ncbi:MAG: hypothetical protein Q7T55_13875, partial [Solirubrobacteraceae bacterium]|nr:hypothetical protein [Solirubrobacteraceae bacterium]
MKASLASESLVELIAAAFHTLVRGWYYDPDGPSAADVRRGEIPVDPWIQDTDDHEWRQRHDATTVDVAATWWEDLPRDWRRRFLALADDAGSAVVAAAQDGRTPIDLVADNAFLTELGSSLRVEWLRPPRVFALEGGVIDRGEAGRVLARVAIHVYARNLVGLTSTLGTVPNVLPSELPHPATLIKVDGARPRDSKYVAFTLRGDGLSPQHRARLTDLIGHPADGSWSRGALHLD